ncbi:unnamed protein product [Ectocarpus sp. 12 AP-2014]
MVHGVAPRWSLSLGWADNRPSIYNGSGKGLGETGVSKVCLP